MKFAFFPNPLEVWGVLFDLNNGVTEPSTARGIPINLRDVHVSRGYWNRYTISAGQLVCPEHLIIPRKYKRGWRLWAIVNSTTLLHASSSACSGDRDKIPPETIFPVKSLITKLNPKDNISTVMIYEPLLSLFNKKVVSETCPGWLGSLTDTVKVTGSNLTEVRSNKRVYFLLKRN